MNSQALTHCLVNAFSRNSARGTLYVEPRRRVGTEKIDAVNIGRIIYWSFGRESFAGLQ